MFKGSQRLWSDIKSPKEYLVRTGSYALDLLSPQCYPSECDSKRAFCCSNKPRSQWKGLLLPHVGLRRKVIGRRVAQWGPGYICRFAGWPSQLEPVGGPSGPGGGSSHRLEGWRYLGPRWRLLAPRESLRAQGQHKHLRAPPGCSLSMCPPTWGHLTRDFSDKRFL